MLIKRRKLLCETTRLAAIIAGAALVATAWTPVSLAAEPIKVGLAITQTGAYSPPGIFELHAYQLAVEEINKAGGLLGRQVKLVEYDDQGNPSTAVQLYQKLLTDDKVNLLLSPYEADLGAAVAPIANRAKVVMAMATANKDLFSGKYPFLVQINPQTSKYITSALDFAKVQGYKTIALLVQNTQFPQALANSVESEAKNVGMRVVFRESYAPNTTDFSALVLKAAKQHPDVIIGATYLADSEGIVRAAKSQNVQAKMFAFSIGPAEPQFYKGLGAAAEGIMGTTLYFPTLHTKGNAEFVKAFTDKFGVAPDYHAAVAYSGINVLLKAVASVGSLDQVKIRDTLLKEPQDTVVGHFKLSPTGLQVGYEGYTLQWQNGKPQLIWPAKDATAKAITPHPGWK